MTDAFVSRNLNKNNDTNEIETKLNITKTENTNFVLQNNVSCNCNETTAPTQNSHLQCVNTKTADGKSLNCFNNTVINNTDEIKNNTFKSETDNNDTILKYVYKKNETNDSKKSKGHYKNSLRRRKRSSIDKEHAQSAPFIVNYETSHTPVVKDREQWLPAKFTANVIKSSDLADFNIETLHDNEDDQKLQSKNRARSENDDHEREHSGELNEDQNENKNSNIAASDESGQANERHEKPNSNERESDTTEDSRENINVNNISNESSQNDDRSTESNAREIDNDNNSKINNLKFTKAQSEESFENSREVGENKNLHGYHNSSPQQLQNVDLDDFSYERIQLNKNGKVETAKDDHDNNPVEIIPATKSHPSVKTHDETNEAPGGSSDSSSDEANEPTHINDGEVKPVVEIIPESESIESDEENSNLNNKNESLETLTGVNEDSSEKYDKLQTEKSRDLNHPPSVKDQFERVPLNYNHKNKKQARNEESDQNKHSEDKDDEGTVDKLTPTRYDDNLNIKFDDIAIKLPEIKLPEDIFTYPYEDPPIYKNKEIEKKQNFFHYNSEEDSAEKPRASVSNDDDVSGHRNEADEDYYGYYDNSKKHQSYNKPKNEAEEEDDDPYEKFVRERFGKRDTFEKRSEKIRDLGAYDPKLYKQVQNIIEKTKKVNDEAAKSGDPNAGYMWTLEYGQNL